ncbi:MAG TPA: alpha/beta fold hydrolase [Actinomycetota bacterium]|nr:alpha/beta fold hydrolase [Actinomycetota bacterium]
MEARAVGFSSGAGPELEGRLAIPDGPRGVAVLCHAYPPMGGSMSNAILPALQRALYKAQWASLRFNFRGVGRSEGSFDGGRGEIEDVAAALAFVRAEAPGATVAVAGWSFGSVVGLVAAVRDGDVAAYAGIAPPVSAGSRIELPALPAPEAAGSLRTLFVCGTQDPVSLPADVERLAQRYGGASVVIDGAGHFFDGRHDVLAGTVLRHLESE